MSLCREWTLVNHTPTERRARPLKCRSWSCELCRPDRKANLLAMAASGVPTRFLTLTVNPRIGTDPADRLRKLAHAWRTLVKRIRREKGPEACEYLAIVEETKAGEPHLHVLLRSPYISQRFISEAMAELIDSPIVDIRLIRNQQEVISYVAKYVTKAPAQFNGSKRYWHSKDWEAAADSKDDDDSFKPVSWQVVKEHLHTVLSDWMHEGWVCRQERHDTVIAFFERTNW